MPIATDSESGVDYVCFCACRHTCELCKNGWTDRFALWGPDSCGHKKPRITWKCTLAPSTGIRLNDAVLCLIVLIACLKFSTFLYGVSHDKTGLRVRRSECGTDWWLEASNRSDRYRTAVDRAWTSNLPCAAPNYGRCCGLAEHTVWSTQSANTRVRSALIRRI